jgi:hypothetical protein
MKDFFDKVLTWVKANIWLAVGLLLVIVVMFFPKLLSGLLGRRRIRHRPGYYASRTITRTRRRSLPRSVGLHKARKQYTKGGKAKKAWQIKGSLAAKRHMAQIRKMR